VQLKQWKEDRNVRSFLLSFRLFVCLFLGLQLCQQGKPWYSRKGFHYRIVLVSLVKKGRLRKKREERRMQIKVIPLGKRLDF